MKYNALQYGYTQLDGNFMSTINNHTIIDAGIRIINEAL